MLSDLKFEKLILDNTPVMYRAARALLGTGTEAEDAVGSAIIAAWRRLNTLRDPEKPGHGL